MVAAHPQQRVSDLLAQHAQRIASLAKALRDEPGFEPSRHDDIWLLRYCLSYPDTASASRAAARGLSWRLKNQQDGVTRRVMALPIDAWPGYLECVPYLGLHVFMAEDAALLVALLVLRRCQFREMAAKVPTQTIIAFLTHLKEYTFAVTDAATRRSGVLHKTLRINLCAGISREIVSPYLWMATARANSGSATAFPQLLHAELHADPPPLLQLLFNRLVKPLLPPKTVEKMALVSTGADGDASAVVGGLLGEANVPDVLGGRLLLGSGLLSGSLREQDEARSAEAGAASPPCEPAPPSRPPYTDALVQHHEPPPSAGPVHSSPGQSGSARLLLGLGAAVALAVATAVFAPRDGGGVARGSFAR
mmetsp:Transcript_4736/g.15654  ORF Transcript_4736/g.15654 Transcript_4736/m.15654 type:complete len:364 (+) Transcript_4736:44-1135(+)